MADPTTPPTPEPPTWTKTPSNMTQGLGNHDFMVAAQPTIDAIGVPALTAAYKAVEDQLFADGAASALDLKAKKGLNVLPPLKSPGGTLYDVDTTALPPMLVVVEPLNTDDVPWITAPPVAATGPNPPAGPGTTIPPAASIP